MISASKPGGVVTLGETMALLRTGEIGSLRHAHDLVLGVGGAESNVAIALQRLGQDASWLGRVGDDPLGERVAREIRAEGVDVRCTVDGAAPTGLMLKERSSSRSTAVYYYRGGSAGSRLTVDDLPEGWVEDAAVLHITGITALLSVSARESLSIAVDRARAAGVIVSFDVNYRSALDIDGDAGTLLRALADRSDLVFGGPDELRLLVPGADDDEAARTLLSSGCREVVMKRGANGATAFLPDGEVSAPAFPVDVIDTVGAGDAFVAGYLSALLNGHEVRDRLHRGNACGAMVCMALGDWEASPRLVDLESFLAPGADPVRR